MECVLTVLDGVVLQSALTFVSLMLQFRRLLLENLCVGTINPFYLSFSLINPFLTVVCQRESCLIKCLNSCGRLVFF